MKKLTDAQRAAIAQLGVAQDDVETVMLTAIERALGDFIERVQRNIDREDMPVTGSITNIFLEVDGNDKVNVYAPSHLVYQDRGVNGAEKKLYPNSPHYYSDKRPPVEPIKDWIRRKNLNLRNAKQLFAKESEFKELDEEKKISSVAYAIREKIYKEGFKPRKIYSKEIPKLRKDLKKEITKQGRNFIIQHFNPRLRNPDTTKVIIFK